MSKDVKLDLHSANLKSVYKSSIVPYMHIAFDETTEILLATLPIDVDARVSIISPGRQAVLIRLSSVPGGRPR